MVGGPQIFRNRRSDLVFMEYFPHPWAGCSVCVGLELVRSAVGAVWVCVWVNHVILVPQEPGFREEGGDVVSEVFWVWE